MVKMEVGLVVVILMNIGLCVANDVVPVLIWGNKNVPDLMTPAAGHSVSSEDFADTVLKQIGEDKTRDILLFMQDKLSLDDITHSAEAYNQDSNGGDLHHVKNLMLSHPSTHLPRVVSPLDAIKSWKNKFGGRFYELKAPFRMSDVPVNNHGQNLVLVHLSEADTLKEADEVIGAISSRMDVLGRQYSAIYTAATSSKAPREQLYVGRHLLQDSQEGPNHFYNISSCIFFYGDNITFQITNGKKANSTWSLEPTSNTTGSTCSPTPLLVLTFTPVDDLKYLKLKVTFTNTSTGYWEAKDWTVSYDTKDVQKTDVPLNVGSIYAPYKHSYHCTTPKIVQVTNKTDTSDTAVAVLNIKNLQLQGYKISNDQFGRANDCIGFFTIPIWMGIISMFVLVSILAFGVIMLNNMKTMDRFDDPKGKTITVNVSD